MAATTVILPHGDGTYEHRYGDISPRTEKYVVAKLLVRGRENIILDKFAQTIPIPKNKSKTVIARRYLSLAPAVTPLTEGVAPNAVGLKYENVSTTLNQYGGLMRITDQVDDFVDDPVLQQMTEISGEQAADTKEALHWAVLSAGTTVFYSGTATSRGTTIDWIDKDDLTKVERFFRRNKARSITRVLGASPNIATEPVPACFVCFAHTDTKHVFEAMTGFLPVEKYASGAPISPNEIGKVGAFRIILSSNFTMLKEAGAYSTTNFTGTNGAPNVSGANSDIYQAVCVAMDAYAVTPLAGAEAVEMFVHSPGKSSSVDNPLAQRGSVGWKFYDASMILNELWVARLEFCVSDTRGSDGSGTSSSSGGSDGSDGSDGSSGGSDSGSDSGTDGGSDGSDGGSSGSN